MFDRFPNASLARRCWRPSADLYRTPDGWLIKLELAGVRAEDVQVQQSGRRLIITGVRRDAVLDLGSTCQSLEISYDSFERRFDFPGDLAELQITCELQNGMLLVRLRQPAAVPETAPAT